MMTDQDRADYIFLLNNAREAIAVSPSAFIHFDQPVGIYNYIRIANEIAKQAAGDILDWGCGYGQMTYLLKQRGFRVTSFDIGSPDTKLPDIPVCRELKVVRSLNPVRLPFPSACFDAVLSCGVLEHVDEQSCQPGNELKSLREIARVLRPEGLLFIYHLPQTGGWQESIIRCFKLGYTHSRRYTLREIVHLLRDAGYEIIHLQRANLLPRNLTGMPGIVRRVYNFFGRILMAADVWLVKIPVINRIAGTLEITARKTG